MYVICFCVTLILVIRDTQLGKLDNKETVARPGSKLSGVLSWDVIMIIFTVKKKSVNLEVFFLFCFKF